MARTALIVVAVHTAVPTVAVARVVEARTVAVAVRVAEEAAAGDWSFWPLAVGYSKP